PETELLVSRAVVRLQSGARTRPLVVDVGTGSGAIAIGIAKACPEVEVIATDISADALAVAAQNASRHGVELDLRRGSLLEPIAEPVDLIVANLPYLSRDEYASLQGTSISYEPRIALTDEEDGLRLFDELLSKAPAELKEGGAILLEIGSTQPRTLQALAKRRLPNMQAAVFVDYAGHARVLELSQR
ncbi:MAG TPA: HemK family protein methyltransferase, partial [Chloroflexota bacterium]|nr:HemK family protein methyltransferase [Chloroflexota bacterium]